MLVLSRKTGQKLIINDNIEIVVIETRGEFVRLGINAPKEVSIYREEIYEEIKQANQQAIAHTTANDLKRAEDLLKAKNIMPTDVQNKFKSSVARIQKKDK